MITVRLFCCFFYLWCELTNIDLVKTPSCASAGFLRRRMSSPDWDVAGMVGGVVVGGEGGDGAFLTPTQTGKVMGHLFCMILRLLTVLEVLRWTKM